VRVNPFPQYGNAARLVLFKADGQDKPIVNAAAFDQVAEETAPGFFTFRKDVVGGRVFTVFKIVAATVNSIRYVLAVVYVPGPTKDDVSVFTDLVTDLGADVAKSWRTVLNADGSLRVPALDADVTTIGTNVKAVWPATWRVWLPGDPLGAPTGARCLGSVLA
jgi:hypothetical protein